jgi:hypothetical protein
VGNTFQKIGPGESGSAVALSWGFENFVSPETSFHAGKRSIIITKCNNSPESVTFIDKYNA